MMILTVAVRNIVLLPTFLVQVERYAIPYELQFLTVISSLRFPVLEELFEKIHMYRSAEMVDFCYVIRFRNRKTKYKEKLNMMKK